MEHLQTIATIAIMIIGSGFALRFTIFETPPPTPHNYNPKYKGHL